MLPLLASVPWFSPQALHMSVALQTPCMLFSQERHEELAVFTKLWNLHLSYRNSTTPFFTPINGQCFGNPNPLEESTSVHLQFVQQYARGTFLASKRRRKGNPANALSTCTAVCLPLLRQYASHLYDPKLMGLIEFKSSTMGDFELK